VATVTPIGPGAYRVEDDGKQVVVFVAGSAGDVWAFCNGEIYRAREERDDTTRGRPSSRPAEAGRYELTSPMPATVVKILIALGQPVRQGDTLVVLEAMKMELPIRAPGDAVVQAINCREGELVQPDRTLVELA
jgi:acetyl-CoA/propionyl-CoA carboxylase biotin carboxyl carrier protein